MHGIDWLPEKLVHRMSARRGRVHAFESFVAQRTALAVIDMTMLFAADLSADDPVLTNINLAAGILRNAGGVVAWVHPREDIHRDLVDAVLGRIPAERFRAGMASGAPGAALHGGLAAMCGDLHEFKHGYSAFFPGACDLPEKLQARGIDTVLIAGAIANVCCEASARDAYGRGFRAVMLADAMIGKADEHRAALAAIYRNYGDVRATNEVLDLLGA